MLESRAVDEREEILKRQDLGMFQLSARGHEALAAIAPLLHPKDLLFPHYRDRALVMARGMTAREQFLDFFGKKEAGSGGRQLPVHYSSRALNIVSVSSPVGTQFLQAVGAALALRTSEPGAIAMAQIGDGTAAQGEVFEAFALAAQEQAPVVFGIEDNGYSISTSTRDRAFWHRPGTIVQTDGGSCFFGIPLARVNGRDPREIYAAAREAVDRARRGDGPSLVIYELDRIAPHSSADPHLKYRTEDEMREMMERDPVATFGRTLVREGLLSEEDRSEMERRVRDTVHAEAMAAVSSPDPDPDEVETHLFPVDDAAAVAVETGEPPEPISKRDGGLDMVAAINRALLRSLEDDPRVCLYGEDIEDPKGGVFGLTAGLSTRHPDRVRNSPLAEATIAGVGVGMAVAGARPVFELQFIDFCGPAWNQIVNEMATFCWRSRGEWTCPLVLMAPCGAYLPGGALWHSQSAEAYFLHTPGLRVVMPSTPADAYGLLRSAVRSEQPVVFLAPKHLFHQPVDLCLPPEFDDFTVPLGQARIARPGSEVTVVAWGNTVHESLAAARELEREGVSLEIIDLRSLDPLDESAIVQSLRKTSRLLVVHEDNRTCGFGGEIIARVTGRPETWELLDAYPARLARTDVHIPYNARLEYSILPDARRIANAARQLMDY